MDRSWCLLSFVAGLVGDFFPYNYIALRTEQGKCSWSTIWGGRVVIESILAGRTFERIFLQKDRRSAHYSRVLDLAQKHRIPCSYVPDRALARMAQGNHQGVVAVLSPIAYASLEMVIQSAFDRGKAPCVVLLDGVTDVHNFGAIARTASCMGVDALVIPMHHSASISGVAMKTSAGALASLPVCRVEALHKALSYLRDSGLKLVACSDRGDQVIYDVDLRDPLALIFGGEERGIAPSHMRFAAQHVKIPMHSNIASLNVSVAVGMVVYEWSRQRRLS